MFATNFMRCLHLGNIIYIIWYIGTLSYYSSNICIFVCVYIATNCVHRNYIFVLNCMIVGDEFD